MDASTTGRAGWRLEERGELTSGGHGAATQARGDERVTTLTGWTRGTEKDREPRRACEGSDVDRPAAPDRGREGAAVRACGRSWADWAEKAGREGVWASFAFSFILKF
jgi:hypothetical protein